MFLLPRTSTVLGIGLGLSLSLSLYPTSPFRSISSPIQCQYTAPYYRSETQAPSETGSGWTLDQNDPSLRKQGHTTIAPSPASRSSASRWLTARTMRQVSLGSILGLVAGVGLRAFSRVLVVVLGMGVVFVEWAASKGYNLLPLNLIQKSVTNVDVNKVMLEHMPFKVSFGMTMALAAFAHFRE